LPTSGGSNNNINSSGNENLRCSELLIIHLISHWPQSPLEKVSVSVSVIQMMEAFHPERIVQHSSSPWQCDYEKETSFCIRCLVGRRKQQQTMLQHLGKYQLNCFRVERKQKEINERWY